MGMSVVPPEDLKMVKLTCKSGHPSREVSVNFIKRHGSNCIVCSECSVAMEGAVLLRCTEHTPEHKRVVSKRVFDVGIEIPCNFKMNGGDEPTLCGKPTRRSAHLVDRRRLAHRRLVVLERLLETINGAYNK